MKNLILFFLAYSYSLLAFSQNLVPNPSFEEYNACPLNSVQLLNLNYWTVFYVSPNYYNKCGDIYYSVPYNWAGSQCPLSGNGYIGLYSYIYSTSILYREVVSSELIKPLVVGKRYYISYNISFADKSICSSNNIGILFTTSNDTAQYLLNNFAHIYTENINADTTNWVNIRGSFIADSAYKYIFIGNFFDNASTDTILTYGQYCSAYYYIDDICVSEDSMHCNNIKNDVINFGASDSIISENDCINFSYSSFVEYDNYFWFFEGASPSFSNNINPTNICYSDTGLYYVKLICYNNSGCADTLIKNNYIRVEKSNVIQNAYSLNDNEILISNPFNEFITLNTNSKSIEILNVFDLLGNKCKIEVLQNKFIYKIIFRQSIPRGVYFLKLKQNNELKVYKLIKS